jgi:hypothetical protein
MKFFDTFPIYYERTLEPGTIGKAEQLFVLRSLRFRLPSPQRFGDPKGHLDSARPVADTQPVFRLDGGNTTYFLAF